RSPPFAQDAENGRAQIIGLDRIDQRSWRRASQRDAVLAEDMAVDDPIAGLRPHHDERAVAFEVGVSGRLPVVTERAPRNVRAFQLSGPLRGPVGNTFMHGLELVERLDGALAVS